MNQIAESDRAFQLHEAKVEFIMRSSDSALFMLRSKCKPQIFQRAFLRLTNRRSERVKRTLTPNSNHSPKDAKRSPCGMIFTLHSFRGLKIRHLI